MKKLKELLKKHNNRPRSFWNKKVKMNKVIITKDSKYVIDLAHWNEEDSEIILGFLELAKKKDWIVTIETLEDKRTEGIN